MTPQKLESLGEQPRHQYFSKAPQEIVNKSFGNQLLKIMGYQLVLLDDEQPGDVFKSVTEKAKYLSVVLLGSRTSD